VLAGCGRPETVTDLEAAKREGIEAIVSLTSTPLNMSSIQHLGFAYLHFPLSTNPSTQQLAKILHFIELQKSQAHPVLVHCGEGKGRTGTILAAYLVQNGMRADDSIQLIRERRPGSIQTAEQEAALREFEKLVIKDRNM